MVTDRYAVVKFLNNDTFYALIRPSQSGGQSATRPKSGTLSISTATQAVFAYY